MSERACTRFDLNISVEVVTWGSDLAIEVEAEAEQIERPQVTSTRVTDSLGSAK